MTRSHGTLGRYIGGCHCTPCKSAYEDGQSRAARRRLERFDLPTLTTPLGDAEWMGDGACNAEGVSVSTFFPGVGEAERERFARALCMECPVTSECLSYAMEHSHLTGIWGGTSERERRKIRNEKNRRERTNA